MASASAIALTHSYTQERYLLKMPGSALQLQLRIEGDYILEDGISAMFMNPMRSDTSDAPYLFRTRREYVSPAHHHDIKEVIQDRVVTYIKRGWTDVAFYTRQTDGGPLAPEPFVLRRIPPENR